MFVSNWFGWFILLNCIFLDCLLSAYLKFSKVVFFVFLYPWNIHYYIKNKKNCLKYWFKNWPMHFIDSRILIPMFIILTQFSRCKYKMNNFDYITWKIQKAQSELTTRSRQSIYNINPIQDVIFGAANGWENSKRPPFPKICYTCQTMMKLGTLVP